MLPPLNYNLCYNTKEGSVCLSFSFIHTGDIHLGRPFSDLSDNKSDICSNACKNAFNKIIDTSITKKVDFVLISGDSFDNDEHDLSTKLLFINNLKKLADNGIKSYVICGNHDPIELYKKYESYFRFEQKYKGMINITGITTDCAQTDYSIDDKILLHSLSFKTSEGLIEGLPVLNADDEKKFNIGLIHCDLDKTESKYAPISREDLRKYGYDYWALGHIHIPEIKEEGMVYCGSPQGRTRKETGAHGCYYVQVEGKTIINTEFIPTDFVRFETIDIDCSDFNNKLEILEEIQTQIEVQPKEVELTFYEVNINGVIDCYNELAQTEDLLKEYKENFEETESKSSIYRINNNTVPKVAEDELLNDKGIIGIIINNLDEVSKEVYDNISELHENLYKKLGLEPEVKEFLSKALEDDKDTTLEQVKNEIKSLCSEVYNIG